MRPAQLRLFRTDDPGVGRYLQDISRFSPLSSREECEMAVRIRRGDRNALEHLVKTNLRFVVSVARNYQHQGMALSDLINEGNLGLIRAARRFDEKKNFRFISYAVWWIRQAMLQALAEHSRILRIPINRVGTIHRVGKTRARLEQRFQRQPDSCEVASELGIAPSEVEHSMRIGTTHASLDAPVGDESSESLGTLLYDDRMAAPDEFCGPESALREVEGLLTRLESREAQVLRLYYGVGCDTTHTLDDIGAILGLTRERVRQIRENALARLRKLAHTGDILHPSP